MAARLDAHRRARIKALGISELEPDEAMATVEALTDSRFGQTIIWRVDLDALLRYGASTGMRTLFEELSPAPTQVIQSIEKEDRVARLRALSSSELNKALQSQLVEQLADTLNTTPAKLDVRAPLIGMGVDSLMAAELRGLIRQELQVDLPFGRLLEGATVLDLVQILSAELTRTAEVSQIRIEESGPRTTRSRGLDAVSTEAVFGKELESGVL
jgi:acyl carrier protein